MTKLTALKTYLTYQLSGIEQQSQQVMTELNALDGQLLAHQQMISQASQTPTILLPEVERSRQQFIAHQYQALERITAQKKPLIAKQDSLTTETIRLKTKLRSLDKYSEKQAKNAHCHYQQVLQKSMDEWVLQGYVS